MKAAILKDFGSVDNLIMQEISITEPADDQILIKIIASSINPIDVKTRIGAGAASIFSVTPPIILGWDLSGVVVRAGKSQYWHVGDEVFGSVNFPGLGQTNAEYALVKASHVARKPSSISHAEAAASAMVGLTAWQALSGHSLNGKRVLIHAASGGVGHIAVQLAKQKGAYVIGTSSQANKDFVMALGADEHIDYQHSPFEEQINNIDFILNTIIDKDTACRSISVLKKGGTLISILPLDEATVKAAIEREVNVYSILMNSCSSDMESLACLLGDKKISVHISYQLPLIELRKAHLLLETGRIVGKIVLIH